MQITMTVIDYLLHYIQRGQVNNNKINSMIKSIYTKDLDKRSE